MEGRNSKCDVFSSRCQRLGGRRRAGASSSSERESRRRRRGVSFFFFASPLSQSHSSLCFFSFPTLLETMSSLKLQRRLAASVLGVGKRALWLDPTETAEIALANSREFSTFSLLDCEPAPAAQRRRRRLPDGRCRPPCCRSPRLLLSETACVRSEESTTLLSRQRVDEKSSAAPGDGGRRRIVFIKKASSIGGDDDGARDASCFCPLQLLEFSVASAPSWPRRDASHHRQWILSPLARAQREESADPAPV